MREDTKVGCNVGISGWRVRFAVGAMLVDIEVGWPADTT